MKLTDSTNDQLMATAAHRYCLGCASYVVDSCLVWLRDTWGDFSAITRQTMVRDTVDALAMGDVAGYRIRMPEGWRAFVAWAWLELTDEQRVWVRRAVRDSNALTDMLSA